MLNLMLIHAVCGASSPILYVNHFVLIHVKLRVWIILWACSVTTNPRYFDIYFTYLMQGYIVVRQLHLS